MNMHMQGEFSTQLTIGAPGRKRLPDIRPIWQISIEPILLRKSDFFDLHFALYDDLVAVQGIQ
jgi:hypothetical protein